MGNKVALITDSTAYIPRDWIDKYGVKVAPSVVIWDGEELRDWYDITAEEFFTRLESSSTMPTTSQPTPAYFKALYDELIAEGKDILGVHISHKLSGTFSSAEQAKAMLTGANIENIDTLSASMGEGWPLLMAIQAAQEGKSLAECREVVEEACNYTGIILTVNTLEFLHRGGRIGGAQRLLGTALNFKPILEVNDGRIEPLERVRTRKKSLARLAELTIERVGDKRPVYMAAIHANAAQDAEQVLEVVAESLPLKARMVTSVAPTVGTHTGPGTVGIAYMAGYEYQS
jgi:DegV family protein with EDD domain